MSRPHADRTDVLERARAAVGEVRDPEIGLPLGELGMLRSVDLEGATVKVGVALTVPGCPMKERIAKEIAASLTGIEGIDHAEVHFDAMSDRQRNGVTSRLRRDRRGTGTERYFDDGRTAVLAVASGKGGVGKSTIAVNLACALAGAGKRVGLLDADVWGFSVPRMLGIEAAPVAFDGMLFPAQAHGVKVVSVGLFAGQREPVVWRGPLLHKTIRQFLAEVYWGELDVLLCDLPPGTGDVPMSLAAMLPDANVLVVTTPQESASSVAERAGRMAERASLRVAGVIENMTAFVCPCCGERTELFGAGGGERLAAELDVPLLASIPAMARLREGGDRGTPLVVSDPDAPVSVDLRRAGERLLELAAPRPSSPDLNVTVVEPRLAAEGSPAR